MNHFSIEKVWIQGDFVTRSVALILIAAMAPAAARDRQDLAYHSAFEGYRRLEPAKDPAGAWRALNDEAGRTDGHVQYGTQVDAHPGHDLESGHVGRGAPANAPVGDAYMKHIVHPSGHARDGHGHHHHH